MGTKNFTNWVSKSPTAQRELGGRTVFDGKAPPQAVLDRIAEEKFTGRYNVKRSNLCGRCYQFRSVVGLCGCD